MEIFIIAVALISSLIIAFMASALNSLTHDSINKNLEANLKNADKLQQLKLHFDDSKEAYIIIEALFYTLTFVSMGILLIQSKMEWYYITAIIFFSFFLVLFLRALFWAIGRRFSDSVALNLTSSYKLLNKTSLPLYNFTNLIIDKVSGKNPDEASREELSAMFETAHEEGAIEPDEYRILKNIIHFSDVLVSDVMTPRTVVFSCHADRSIESVIDLPELQMYSRFPIYEGESIDNGVVGYIMSRDILYAALKGNSSKKLRDFSREVYIIPENAELDKALDQFLQRKQHIAIVVDEYGGVEGLLTMEDVMETILGVEIVDEADKVVDLRLVAKERRDKRIAGMAIS
jgi:CBS domain containing-hemolysin-like protein